MFKVLCLLALIAIVSCVPVNKNTKPVISKQEEELRDLEGAESGWAGKGIIGHGVYSGLGNGGWGGLSYGGWGGLGAWGGPAPWGGLGLWSGSAGRGIGWGGLGYNRWGGYNGWDGAWGGYGGWAPPPHGWNAGYPTIRVVKKWW